MNKRLTQYPIQKSRKSPGTLQMLRGLVRLSLASKTPHLPTFTTFGPLEVAGIAKALESGPLGPARHRWGARNRSFGPRSASPRRSNWTLEPARPRWVARRYRAARTRMEQDRSGVSGDIEQGRVTDACCSQHRVEHIPCMECTGTH